MVTGYQHFMSLSANGLSPYLWSSGDTKSLRRRSLTITQDTFNKVLSLILILFFMTLYTFSFITGKEVNWTILLTLIVPMINNAVSQYTQAQLAIKTKVSDTAVNVAQIQSTNGNTSVKPEVKLTV